MRTMYQAQESLAVEIRSEVIIEQRREISPSGSREKRCGDVREQTCKNGKDVLQGVEKHNRTCTSQRGCERVGKRLREEDYERGEKS